MPSTIPKPRIELSFIIVCAVGGITPILQMRNLRHHMTCSKSHTASTWPSVALNPGRAVILTAELCCISLPWTALLLRKTFSFSENLRNICPHAFTVKGFSFPGTLFENCLF